MGKTEDLISAFTGKMLRDRFGKGPESIYVSMDEHCMVLHIRNFIGPVEKFLLSQQEEKSLRHIRELLMKSLLPELKEYLKNEAGFEPSELYYDWGWHNASGMILALSPGGRYHGQRYEGEEEVHSQVIGVSRQVQKEPDRIHSWWLNRRTLVVIREGILIPLELELIALGYEDVLKTTKRKLEKRYLEHETGFSVLFGKEMTDFYVDWNFESDRSVIVYTFRE